MVKIAPSILSADFSKLKDDVLKVENAGAEWLHLDVMDGVFVPNISFGPLVVKAVRPYSKIVFDVHLMIVNPENYIKQFREAGADYITVHEEATSDLKSCIKMIKDLGAKAGVSLKPNTDISVLDDVLPDLDLVLIMTVEPGFGGQKFMQEQIEKVKALVSVKDRKFLISVDGGINDETCKIATDAGVDVLVAGNYVYGAADIKAAIDSLRGI